MVVIGNTLLWAQDRKITGNVTDVSGPFLGATIVVKGTNIGTTTGLDGNYSINVPDSENTLVFSAVGMKTVEKKIGSRTSINVKLATDTEQLNEVVITALGIKGERDKFASSVTTVDGAKSGGIW